MSQYKTKSNLKIIARRYAKCLLQQADISDFDSSSSLDVDEREYVVKQVSKMAKQILQETVPNSLWEIEEEVIPANYKSFKIIEQK